MQPVTIFANRLFENCLIKRLCVKELSYGAMITMDTPIRRAPLLALKTELTYVN